jgi:preprotein translocase subunit SecY
MVEYLQPGTIWYFVLTAVLILFFTYFYTAIIFNPVDIAENLKKQSAFIPGVKPGARTAEYIDRIVTRITLPGAVFLTFIALLPIVLSDMVNTPFRFGGTSLLIVVGVAMDTVTQIEAQLIMRHYDGFTPRSGRIRGRRTW